MGFTVLFTDQLKPIGLTTNLYRLSVPDESI